MKKEEIKKIVREGYTRVAKQDSSCCTPAGSCCGSTDLAQDISKKIGYKDEELKDVPVEKVKEVANSVVSIKVYGTKPNRIT